MRATIKSLALAMPTSLLACSDGGTSAPETGPGIEVAVAPLTLEGVSNPCYGVTVDNGLFETVWSRGAATSNSLCSSQFGNGAGGDISYVGPCDADAPGHTVFLVVENIYDNFDNPVVEGTDWINPCP